MTGRIDISQLNTPPDKSEFAVAKYFAELGKDIMFISPSAIPGQHRPDILMDGVEWEIKCPEGSSKRTIENAIRTAVRQSKSIIIDLLRIQLSDSSSVSNLEKEFNGRKYIKRIYVIRKNGSLLLYSR